MLWSRLVFDNFSASKGSPEKMTGAGDGEGSNMHHRMCTTCLQGCTWPKSSRVISISNGLTHGFSWTTSFWI